VWSEEEEREFLAAAKRFNRQWSQIRMRLFPLLTAEQLKNKFYLIQQNKAKEEARPQV